MENKFREAYILQIKNTPVVTLSHAEESIDNFLELIQYDEITTINLSFYPVKTNTTPDSLGIPSLHFDQLK